MSEDKKFERKEHYLTPDGEYSLFNCTDPYKLINHIVNRILVELRDVEECTLIEVCDCDCIKFKITKKREDEIMASKVNATPTLEGIDAKRFIDKLKSPLTPKEVESLKRADEVFKKIKYIH